MMFCVSFRSLTSSSGVTNTWRKGLRRRLKRFVKGVFTGTHSTCSGHVSEFMTILFQLKCKKKKVNMFDSIQSTGLCCVCCLAAAAVSQGLHRVWAQQAGHANRNSAGQRQSLCVHSKQPLQWEPGQRRYLPLGVPSCVVCCFTVKSHR